MSSITGKLISTLFILLVFLPFLMSAHNTNGNTPNFITGHRSQGCNKNQLDTTTVASTPCQKSPAIQATPAKIAGALVFADQRLELVYPVIQKFKSTITSDPLGVTKSWVGSDICSYRGFYCDTPPGNSSAIALASIDFNGFHLVAPTLDGFLENLPDIALFHANPNNFSGTITPKIAKL